MNDTRKEEIHYAFNEARLSRYKSPKDYNIGSSNYSKLSIQPWEVWEAWDLNPWDADIVKRIARTKDVSGMSYEEARIEDYEKIKHICDYRIGKLKYIKT